MATLVAGKKPRVAAPVLGLVIALFVVVSASILLGSNLLDPATVWSALLDRSQDTESVVWGSRIPRTLLGLLVGACLGVAGTVMQGQTRNPLADPGIFGVSAGASFAVVLGMYVLNIKSMIGNMWMAFFGAIIATIIVFAVAALGRGLSNPVPMAIGGMAVSALFGSLTSFLVLTDEDTLAGYRIWVVGSLSGRTLDGAGVVLCFAVLGMILAALNIKSLNALSLGSEMAAGLGENIVRARIVGLAAITLLTASAVALTGPIGFVGLTAPHVARALVGSDFRRLVPASGIVGAAVLLLCDVVGRLLGGNSEVAVGVVLSVLGGCVFVSVVRRGRMVAL